MPFESCVSSEVYAALSNSFKLLQHKIEELEIENDKLKERNQSLQYEKWSLYEKLEQITKDKNLSEEFKIQHEMSCRQMKQSIIERYWKINDEIGPYKVIKEAPIPDYIPSAGGI